MANIARAILFGLSLSRLHLTCAAANHVMCCRADSLDLLFFSVLDLNHPSSFPLLRNSLPLSSAFFPFSFSLSPLLLCLPIVVNRSFPFFLPFSEDAKPQSIDNEGLSVALSLYSEDSKSFRFLLFLVHPSWWKSASAQHEDNILIIKLRDRN